MKVLRAAHGMHNQLGLRIRKNEQADPGKPEHPPGHLVGTEFVGKISPQRAQHATGQGKAGRQKSRILDVETVLGHVILGHPQRQRDIAAEDDGVILGILPHLGILQSLQLLTDAGTGRRVMRRIIKSEQPEKDHRTQHDGRIHLRHRLPAPGQHDGRRNQLGHRRAGIARAENPHGQPLTIARKPARAIRRTHGEGTTGDTDEQTRHQKMPKSRGMGNQPDRHDGRSHQHRKNHAPTELVGQHAQRQTDQRTRQHRHGHQQAKLGFIQLKRFLDRDADHGKHHPHHETHGEGKGAQSHDGPLLARLRSHENSFQDGNHAGSRTRHKPILFRR